MMACGTSGRRLAPFYLRKKLEQAASFYDEYIMAIYVF